MAAHAKLGGSTASRWSNCLAAGTLAVAHPDLFTGGGKAAREGTIAHTLLENCLRDDVKPTEYMGLMLTHVEKHEGVEFPTEYLVDADMADAVELAFNEVQALCEHHDLTMELEKRVCLLEEPADGIGDLFGTADVVLTGNGKVYIIDYKHGAGVSVFVEDNLQLMFYAAAVVNSLIQENKKPDALGVEEWSDLEIHVGIIQPRSFGNPDVQIEKRSYDDLVGFVKNVRDKVQNIAALLKHYEETGEIDESNYKAGSWCAFCPVMHNCPARTKLASEVAQTDFENADIPDSVVDNLPDPKEMDSITMQNVLKYGSDVKKWIDAVHSHAQSIMSMGVSVEGFKLVISRQTRDWFSDDDEEVLAELEKLGVTRKQATVSKLQTQTALRKLVDKEALDNLLVKKKPSLTVVPESDKRDEVVSETLSE